MLISVIVPLFIIASCLHLEFVSESQNHNFHQVSLLHFYYIDGDFENYN